LESSTGGSSQLNTNDPLAGMSEVRAQADLPAFLAPRSFDSNSKEIQEWASKHFNAAFSKSLFNSLDMQRVVNTNGAILDASLQFF
jgi:heptaprenylglyceryl phosphate synthase